MKTKIIYTNGDSEIFEGEIIPSQVCALSSIKWVIVYNDDNVIMNMYNPNDI
jgi:hypothetical protein